MMMSMMMINLMMTTSFMFISHPMSMGLILLSQTTLIALITGLLTQNFWFSYILFMIMIGGMLVLFIYMTSVASNEKFMFSNNLSMVLLMMTSMLIPMMFMDKSYSFSIMKTIDTSNMNMKLEFSTSMAKYFNFPLSIWMISMMIYLLLALIAVVKITNITYGPLRQKL